MNQNSFLFILSFVFLSSVGLAQEIKTGTYRFLKDQNEAVIKPVGEKLNFKSWDYDLTFEKSADGYRDAQYNYYLKNVSDDIVVFGHDTYPIKEELSLYAPDSHNNTNPAITEFVWQDQKYYAIEGNDLQQLIGEYLYEGGEPKAVLNNNSTGSFQRHMSPPSPVVWWGIETDYKGEIQKTGTEQDYKVILVVKYGAGGSRYDTPGSYDRMQLVVSNSQRKSIIMGERIFNW